MRQDPVLSRVKLISEPWDIGPGGYQLGNHPPGFAEWNDRFRDGVRRFWRGDAGQRADFAARLAGSSDLFDQRAPAALGLGQLSSPSHDGFTLRDIVSYAERHNEANGEDNQDGHGENYSANWGAEGPTDDPGDPRDARTRLQRAMLATLFLAQGTPMLLARRRVRPHAARQQQRLLPGQRDVVDRLEHWPARPKAQGSRGLRRAADRGLRHAIPCCARRHFLHGAARSGRRASSTSPGSTHRGEIDLGRVLEQSRGSLPRLAARRPRNDDGSVDDVDLPSSTPTRQDRAFQLAAAALADAHCARQRAPDAPERDLDGEEIAVVAAQRRAGAGHCGRRAMTNVRA